MTLSRPRRQVGSIQHTEALCLNRNKSGYKVAAEVKSPEEYAKMDADDEALNRWKASLGITGSAAAGEGPKVRSDLIAGITLSNVFRITSEMQLTLLSLELTSPTLPPGKTIVLDLTDPSKLEGIKKEPVTIKEGIEYKYVHLCLIPRI